MVRPRDVKTSVRSILEHGSYQFAIFDHDFQVYSSPSFGDARGPGYAIPLENSWAVQKVSFEIDFFNGSLAALVVSFSISLPRAFFDLQPVSTITRVVESDP